MQFVSNLFLPGGFELAKYADSKVGDRQSAKGKKESKCAMKNNFSQCDVETATGVYSCLSLDMQVGKWPDIIDTNVTVLFGIFLKVAQKSALLVNFECISVHCSELMRGCG